MIEGYILKTSITEKTNIALTIISILISLNNGVIINTIIFSCNGYGLGKTRSINLFLPFCISLCNSISFKCVCNRKALISIILVTCSLSVTLSNKDNLVLVPRTFDIKQTISFLPCLYRMLIIQT